jgi:hypothetical protein
MGTAHSVEALNIKVSTAESIGVILSNRSIVRLPGMFESWLSLLPNVAYHCLIEHHVFNRSGYYYTN